MSDLGMISVTKGTSVRKSDIVIATTDKEDMVTVTVLDRVGGYWKIKTPKATLTKRFLEFLG